LQVMSQDGITVALDVSVSEELKKEGLAREFVNRIQNVRKDKDFDVTDKISIVVEKNVVLEKAITDNLSYICGETLADSLEINAVNNNDKVLIDLIDGLSVNVEVKKI